MPYISPNRRREIIKGSIPENSGELNYELTLDIIGYMDSKGGLSYKTINDIIGALEGCKLEFYHRLARPYEDIKIKNNGDVYNETIS